MKRDPCMPEKERIPDVKKKKKNTRSIFSPPSSWVDSFSWLGKKVPHQEIVVDL